MLTILGKPQGKFCDGMSRRSFLTIGAAGIGGLTLPQLLAAEAKAGIGTSHKAVINIFLPGGPPHQDMWDIKSDAPKEIRGEFKPIKTNVPGIEIGELFPKLAGMMDKLIPIRSMVGASGGHDAYQCMTGRKKGSPGSPPGGWASHGAWISRLKGPVKPGVPAFLSLCYDTSHKQWGDPGTSGFLGIGHSPFRCVGGKSDNMVLQGITLERLQDRQSLLRSVDRFRREADARGLMEGMDTFTQQAVGILTTSELADALDLSKEDPKIVERYGKGDPKHKSDGAPKMVENFCIARRLIEAGARAVTLNFSRWDWHGGNFKRSRQDMPMLDNAVSALVGDLHDRGMLGDVSVVVWGEFGRTPKINKNAGRDHWPKVSCALLAGGGMRTGQVIGATNRLGEEAVERPVTFAEVHATLYHNMGLLKGQERVFDLRGRPQYPINPSAKPMRELI